MQTIQDTDATISQLCYRVSSRRCSLSRRSNPFALLLPLHLVGFSLLLPFQPVLYSLTCLGTFHTAQQRGKGVKRAETRSYEESEHATKSCLYHSPRPNIIFLMYSRHVRTLPQGLDNPGSKGCLTPDLTPDIDSLLYKASLDRSSLSPHSHHHTNRTPPALPAFSAYLHPHPSRPEHERHHF